MTLEPGNINSEERETMSENDLKCDRCGASVRTVLRDGWLCQSCARRTYGARDERAAIVAWLREEAQRLCIEDDVIQDEAAAVKGYARAIELGEHLQGDGV